MGIKNFKKEFQNKFPQTKIFLSPEEQGIFDHVLIDGNSILHDVVKAPNGFKGINQRLNKALNDLLSQVKPKKSIYIYLDGVSPISRLQLMQLRRINTADNNQLYLTPGTVQYSRLKGLLAVWAASYVKHHSDVKVIINAADTPGEGEVKLIRDIKSYPLEDSFCILSQDSDSILIGMAALRPNIAVLGTHPPGGFHAGFAAQEIVHMLPSDAGSTALYDMLFLILSAFGNDYSSRSFTKSFSGLVSRVQQKYRSKKTYAPILTPMIDEHGKVTLPLKFSINFQELFYYVAGQDNVNIVSVASRNCPKESMLQTARSLSGILWTVETYANGDYSDWMWLGNDKKFLQLVNKQAMLTTIAYAAVHHLDSPDEIIQIYSQAELAEKERLQNISSLENKNPNLSELDDELISETIPDERDTLRAVDDMDSDSSDSDNDNYDNNNNEQLSHSYNPETKHSDEKLKEFSGSLNVECEEQLDSSNNQENNENREKIPLQSIEEIFEFRNTPKAIPEPRRPEMVDKETLNNEILFKRQLMECFLTGDGCKLDISPIVFGLLLLPNNMRHILPECYAFIEGLPKAGKYHDLAEAITKIQRLVDVIDPMNLSADQIIVGMRYRPPIIVKHRSWFEKNNTTIPEHQVDWDELYSLEHYEFTTEIPSSSRAPESPIAPLPSNVYLQDQRELNLEELYMTLDTPLHRIFKNRPKEHIWQQFLIDNKKRKGKKRKRKVNPALRSRKKKKR
eukprot:gb/GECH01003551.1/.p1 GENE.gb/GECH01003551.1/~~gb/GECH01003551.1/.p1  ORF type:complete len:737 (+),score=149.70 gb/GECH01003551.1/:1-2211(+)